MQRATVSSQRPPLPVEVMTAWKRRVLLGMLVGLAALVNVAFNYAGPSFASSDQMDWSHAMLGGLLAQASLLAVWAGWGQQPITPAKEMWQLLASWSQVRPKAAAEFYRTHATSSGAYNAAAASNTVPISNAVRIANAINE